MKQKIVCKIRFPAELKLETLLDRPLMQKRYLHTDPEVIMVQYRDLLAYQAIAQM